MIITGVRGFIGAAFARHMLERGETVLGIDYGQSDRFNRIVGSDVVDDHYQQDRAKLLLQEARGNGLLQYPRYSYQEADLSIPGLIEPSQIEGEVVVHMAGALGVVDSMRRPARHIEAHIMTAVNVLERRPAAFIYASSSTVYGDGDGVALSPYAAAKQCVDSLAAIHAMQHGIPAIGMRFFSVYGPWGNPDHAFWIFADRLARGEDVTIYGGEANVRDYVYIDDVVIALSAEAALLSGNPEAGHRVYDVASGERVKTANCAAMIRERLASQGIGPLGDIKMDARRSGEAESTHADESSPHVGGVYITPIRDGICQFVDWWVANHYTAADA